MRALKYDSLAARQRRANEGNRPQQRKHDLSFQHAPVCPEILGVAVIDDVEARALRDLNEFALGVLPEMAGIGSVKPDALVGVAANQKLYSLHQIGRIRRLDNHQRARTHDIILCGQHDFGRGVQVFDDLGENDQVEPSIGVDAAGGIVQVENDVLGIAAREAKCGDVAVSLPQSFGQDITANIENVRKIAQPEVVAERNGIINSPRVILGIFRLSLSGETVARRHQGRDRHRGHRRNLRFGRFAEKRNQQRFHPLSTHAQSGAIRSGYGR